MQLDSLYPGPYIVARVNGQPDKGSLFWKFLKDGVMIAFYLVFGEVVFFYLLSQELQKEPLPEEPVEMLADAGEGADENEGDVSVGILDDPTEIG